MTISFGPVPSRRLGRSLGVNNIPYKVCTYACVYCQLGKTLKMDIERKEFYKPDIIFEDVKKRTENAKDVGEKIDYITFVPDGEPTLDLNLGEEVKMLKNLRYPLAILTNGSLIWDEDVKKALLEFDYVSIKVDVVTEKLWRKIDRPYKKLDLKKILDGIKKFSKEYDGKLVTETMLLDGIDYSKELIKIAEFLEEIEPYIAYIAIPIRPPAEKWVKPPGEELIAQVYHEFSEKVDNVEYLIGYEGSDFAATGNLKEDILSITAVHPMREEAVKEILSKANASFDIIEDMIKSERIKRVEYGGNIYYIRKFKDRNGK